MQAANCLLKINSAKSICRMIKEHVIFERKTSSNLHELNILTHIKHEKRSVAVKMQNIPTHTILTCTTLRCTYKQRSYIKTFNLYDCIDTLAFTEQTIRRVRNVYVCAYAVDRASRSLRRVHILTSVFSDFALILFL